MSSQEILLHAPKFALIAVIVYILYLAYMGAYALLTNVGLSSTTAIFFELLVTCAFGYLLYYEEEKHHYLQSFN